MFFFVSSLCIKRANKPSSLRRFIRRDRTIEGHETTFHVLSQSLWRERERGLQFEISRSLQALSRCNETLRITQRACGHFYSTLIPSFKNIKIFSQTWQIL